MIVYTVANIIPASTRHSHRIPHAPSKKPATVILLLVMLILFLTLAPFSGAKESPAFATLSKTQTSFSSSLKHPLVSDSRRRGTPILKHIGTSVKNGVLSPLGKARRTLLYDPVTGKFGSKRTVNHLTNFDMRDSKFNQDTSAYVQGVAMYSFMGITFFILVLIWCCCLTGINIWACCITYHKKPVVVEKKQSNKVEELPGNVPDSTAIDLDLEIANLDHKYQRRTNVMRFALAVGVVTVLIFMIILTVFTFLASFGISDTVIGISDSVDKVQNMATTVAGATNSALSIVDSINSAIDSINETIIQRLPTNATLSGYSHCLDGILHSLPNITIIIDVVNNIGTRVKKIPSGSSIKSLVQSLESDVRMVRDTQLPTLKQGLIDLQLNISLVPSALDHLQTLLQNIQSSINSFPDTNRSRAVLSQLRDPLDNTITYSFLTDLASNVTNLSKNSPRETARNLRLLADTLDQMKSADIQGLYADLYTLNQSIVDFPDPQSVIQAIMEVETTVNNINPQMVLDDLTQLSNTMTNITTRITQIQSSINNISSTLTNLPSLERVYRETAKLNDTVHLLSCSDRIVDDITDINATIAELPATINTAVDNFVRFKTEITSINLDAKLNELNETIRTQIPEALSNLNQLKLDNITNQLPNVNELIARVETARQEYQSARDSLNFTEAINTLESIPINDAPDLTNMMNSIIALNNTLQSIDTDRLNEFASKIENLPDPCDEPNCPDIPVTEEQIQIAGAIIRFRDQVAQLPSSEEQRQQLDQYDSMKASLPNLSSYITQIDTTSNRIENIKALNSALKEIDNSQRKVNNLINMTPWGTIYNQLGKIDTTSMLKELNALENTLENYQKQINFITNFDILSKFLRISELVNSMDISQFSKGFTSVVKETNKTVNNVMSSMDTVLDMRDKYIPTVYRVDAAQLFICCILILVILPVPLIGLAPVFSPKRCLWSLLLLAGLYALIALGSCVVVALTLPTGIFFSDTCDNMQTYANSTIFAYGGKNLMKRIDIKLDVPNGKKVSISVIPADLVPLYLNNCEGEDPLSDAIVQIKDIISNVTAVYSQQIKDLGSLDGFKIRPGVYNLVEGILNDLDTDITHVLDNLLNTIECSNINQVYREIKEVPCQNGTYSAGALWLVALLLFILATVASISSTMSYIFMKINLRLQEQQGKRSTPADKPAMSQEASKPLDAESSVEACNKEKLYQSHWNSQSWRVASQTPGNATNAAESTPLNKNDSKNSNNK